MLVIAQVQATIKHKYRKFTQGHVTLSACLDVCCESQLAIVSHQQKQRHNVILLEFMLPSCVPTVHHAPTGFIYKVSVKGYFVMDNRSIKGLLHGYEWGLRFGGLELRFG